MTDPQEIASLILKQLEGSITEAEQAVLNTWAGLSAANRAMLEEMQDEEGLSKNLVNFHPERWEAANSRIRTKVQEATIPVRRIHWFRYAAAVLLITLGGTITYVLLDRKPSTIITHIKDVAPGKEGAILTLDDGTEVVLDSLGNGVVARQQGALVVLQQGGLTYSASGNSGGELAYNTLATPKGRQFQLTLPDGTKVWLNAASSIRYPTVFDKERNVEVRGEAYFEVVKSQIPFRVNLDSKGEVEVLGTHFNVNAYENEQSINTTLLEGAVRVNGTTIRPGQQARISPQGVVKVVVHADTSNVMAWKNGFFSFENIPVQEAMRQIERWYNVDVVYENGVPDIRFGGEISRKASLATLLDMLAGAKMKFRIEGGKKLIIEK